MYVKPTTLESAQHWQFMLTECFYLYNVYLLSLHLCGFDTATEYHECMKATNKISSCKMLHKVNYLLFSSITYIET